MFHKKVTREDILSALEKANLPFEPTIEGREPHLYYPVCVCNGDTKDSLASIRKRYPSACVLPDADGLRCIYLRGGLLRSDYVISCGHVSKSGGRNVTEIQQRTV